MNARSSTRTAVRAPSKSAVSLALMFTSLVALDGCQAIKAIFKVGFGMGVLVVVAVVAVIGGIIAVATRK